MPLELKAEWVKPALHTKWNWTAADLGDITLSTSDYMVLVNADETDNSQYITYTYTSGDKEGSCEISCDGYVTIGNKYKAAYYCDSEGKWICESAPFTAENNAVKLDTGSFPGKLTVSGTMPDAVGNWEFPAGTTLSTSDYLAVYNADESNPGNYLVYEYADGKASGSKRMKKLGDKMAPGKEFKICYVSAETDGWIAVSDNFGLGGIGSDSQSANFGEMDITYIKSGASEQVICSYNFDSSWASKLKLSNSDYVYVIEAKSTYDDAMKSSTYAYSNADGKATGKATVDANGFFKPRIEYKAIYVRYSDSATLLTSRSFKADKSEESKGKEALAGQDMMGEAIAAFKSAQTSDLVKITNSLNGCDMSDEKTLERYFNALLETTTAPGYSLAGNNSMAQTYWIMPLNSLYTKVKWATKATPFMIKCIEAWLEKDILDLVGPSLTTMTTAIGMHIHVSAKICKASIGSLLKIVEKDPVQDSFPIAKNFSSYLGMAASKFPKNFLSEIDTIWGCLENEKSPNDMVNVLGNLDKRLPVLTEKQLALCCAEEYLNDLQCQYACFKILTSVATGPAWFRALEFLDSLIPLINGTTSYGVMPLLAELALRDQEFFFDQLDEILLAVQSNQDVAIPAAQIIGAVGRVDEKKATECLDHLLGMLKTAKANYQPTILNEIRNIAGVYKAQAEPHIPTLKSMQSSFSGDAAAACTNLLEYLENKSIASLDTALKRYEKIITEAVAEVKEVKNQVDTNTQNIEENKKAIAELAAQVKAAQEYLDAHIEDMRSFLDECVEKLPTPTGFDCRNRLGGLIKSIHLQFKCARQTPSCWYPDKDFETSSKTVNKWLRVAVSAVKLGKAVFMQNPADGISAIADAYHAVRTEYDSDFQTFCSNAILRSDERDKLIDGLRQAGFFMFFKFDSEVRGWSCANCYRVGKGEDVPIPEKDAKTGETIKQQVGNTADDVSMVADATGIEVGVSASKTGVEVETGCKSCTIL